MPDRNSRKEHNLSAPARNLPSVVAIIIIVCIKGLLVQLLGVKQIWERNKLDGVVFVVTCVSVILLDIELGLMVGVIASVMSIVYRSVKPYSCTLSPVEESIYLDNHYFKDTCPSNIKLFRYFGPVNFSTYNHFRCTFYEGIGFNPEDKKKQLRATGSEQVNIEGKWKEDCDQLAVRVVVVDLSCVPSIDANGLLLIKEIYEELAEVDVHLLFSGVHGHLLYILEKIGSKLPGTNHFPSIEDAFGLAKSLSCVGASSRF